MTAESAMEREQVEEASRLMYRWVSECAETIGGIDVAAGVCGIDRGDLRRGIDRNGRYVRGEHFVAIGARASRYNPTLATKLGSAMVQALGLEVFPRVSLTPEEKARRLEELIRRMPMGEQMLAEALK